MHLSHLLAQFIRSIYNAVEKSYCSLHWFRLLPSLLSVATLPLVYMEKSRSQIICHTFSQYLNTLHSLAGNMEERLSIRSTARSPRVMMSLPLKLYLQTPAKLGRGTTASTSSPTAGSLISTDVRPGNYLVTILSVIYLYMRYFTSRRVIHSVAVLMASRISHFLAGNNLLGKARAKGKSSQSPAVRIRPSQTS